MRKRDYGDDVMNEVRPGVFSCPCCSGEEWVPGGEYSLPPRRDPEGGLVDVRYPLAKCTHCGHVAAHPAPTAIDIDRYYGSSAFWRSQGVVTADVGSDWRAKVTANSGLWERFKRAQRQLDFIRRSVDIGPDAKIVDLGSGYSPFLFQCRVAGYESLYALEPSEDVCDFLTAQGVVTYPEMLEEFVERDDLPRFDVMVISHTVEHLRDPRTVIEGLRKHLAQGGVLYVDVPFEDHLRPYHQGFHLQFFNVRSISELAERTGFLVKSVETDRFGFLDRALLSILYRLYGAFFGGKGGVTTRPSIEFIHKAFWRPFKTALSLKINIFISSKDLRAVLIEGP